MAGGMALGLFVALLPVLGLQLPLALVLTEAIRRVTHFQVSRVAAAAGVWLNNPLTFAPLYTLCYFTGRPLAHRLLPYSLPHGDGAVLDWSQQPRQASARPASRCREPSQRPDGPPPSGR